MSARYDLMAALAKGHLDRVYDEHPHTASGYSDTAFTDAGYILDDLSRLVPELVAWLVEDGALELAGTWDPASRSLSGNHPDDGPDGAVALYRIGGAS